MSVLSKRLTVVVAGTGHIHDIEVHPGTTTGDLLKKLDLQDGLLTTGPNEPFFADSDSVYDKVSDGGRIYVSFEHWVAAPTP